MFNTFHFHRYIFQTLQYSIRFATCIPANVQNFTSSTMRIHSEKVQATLQALFVSKFRKSPRRQRQRNNSTENDFTFVSVFLRKGRVKDDEAGSVCARFRKRRFLTRVTELHLTQFPVYIYIYISLSSRRAAKPLVLQIKSQPPSPRST